jgi:dual specificity protein kinase YAK1
MDPQWGSYSDSSGAARRYNGSGSANTSSSSSSQVPRDYNGQLPSRSQPPVGFKYEQYQGPPSAMGSHSAQNSTTSPISNPQGRDGNGDIPMQDVHDPYSPMKYPMRPHHQSNLSGGRPANLHSSSQEPSSAAQRYSPMEALSPTSPYAPKSATQNQYANAPPQRQSPTRQPDYNPQSPYYASRQPGQLPPLSSYTAGGHGHETFSPSAIANMEATYANDPKSPRRVVPQAMAMPVKGPVPEFKKLRSLGELQPKVNKQPPFRRANPEGGFISVSPIPPPSSTILLIDPESWHSSMLTSYDSPYKRSPSICRRPIEFATRTSNTSCREIPDVC